jgi:glycerol-3-phosphate dehydrogenase
LALEMSVYDVAIVGGGISGCAVARELSRYRLKVILLESQAEVGFGVSKANSGIIHAGHYEPEGSLKGDLAAEGNQLYTQLAADLGLAFERIGELVVALVPEDLPVLEQLKRQGESRGLEGLEFWDRRRLRREEPNPSHDLLAALHVPGAGVINPYEVCLGLAASAARNGVEIACSVPVQGVRVDDGRLVLATPGREVAARFVINAAGLHADKYQEHRMFLVPPLRAAYTPPG